MEFLQKPLLILHIIAGFISIIVFWLPIFTRKGSKSHITSGRLYIYSMWGVVITAALLSIIRVIQGNYGQAMILGFLSLITAQPLWVGIAIFREKRGLSNTFLWIRRVFVAIITVYGGIMVSMVVFGEMNNIGPLHLIFGALGLITGIADLVQEHKFRKRKPIVHHYASMIITGAAAYTAFFAFGARSFLEQILTGNLMLIPWIMPTALAMLTVNLMQRGKLKVA
ncbi:MAG: hypothetical protein AAF206_27510 [Bacteroidota bacterium]